MKLTHAAVIKALLEGKALEYTEVDGPDDLPIRLQRDQDDIECLTAYESEDKEDTLEWVMGELEPTVFYHLQHLTDRYSIVESMPSPCVLSIIDILQALAEGKSVLFTDVFDVGVQYSVALVDEHLQVHYRPDALEAWVIDKKVCLQDVYDNAEGVFIVT